MCETFPLRSGKKVAGLGKVVVVSRLKKCILELIRWPALFHNPKMGKVYPLRSSERMVDPIGGLKNEVKD